MNWKEKIAELDPWVLDPENPTYCFFCNCLCQIIVGGYWQDGEHTADCLWRMANEKRAEVTQ